MVKNEAGLCQEVMADIVCHGDLYSEVRPSPHYCLFKLFFLINYLYSLSILRLPVTITTVNFSAAVTTIVTTATTTNYDNNDNVKNKL